MILHHEKNLTFEAKRDALIDVNRTGRYIEHQYGAGRGQIWLENLRCTGSETSIAECEHNDWGVHNCNHDEDVSVSCSNNGKFNPATAINDIFC